MRDIREVPIPGGSIAAINTGSGASPVTVLPFDCEVIGVAWWCDKTIATTSDVDHEFDVKINTVDQTIDLHIKDGVAQGIGYFDSPVYAAAGDSITLTSQNQQITASSAWYCTYIVKPS